MAIFSLNHGWVGRRTDAPRTASFHARYIMRPEACTRVLGERMPTDPSKLYAYLDAEEIGDRRNARVIDKLIVALPVELDAEERAQLVHDFAERMTEGQAKWVAAIHDSGEQAHNPHAHIIFRDRDEEGRRVMMTSERGSTQRLRDGWEQEVNIALERAGREERVDSRSLADQGIDREPQIHVGQHARDKVKREQEFDSQAKEVTRIIDGERATVTVNYPEIDQGRSRFEENEARKERNRERALLQQEISVEGVERAATIYEQFARLGTMPGDAADPVGAAIVSYPVIQQAQILADENAGRDLQRMEREEFKEDIAMEAAIREAYRASEVYLQFATLGTMPGDATEPMAALVREHMGEPWERWNDRDDTPEVEREVPGVGIKAPSRDAFDALGGGGLAIIGRIAEAFESMIDGPTPEQRAKEELSVAEERKTEQQQRMEAYLRDKEQRERAAEAEAYRQAQTQHMIDRWDSAWRRERSRRI